MKNRSKQTIISVLSVLGVFALAGFPMIVSARPNMGTLSVVVATPTVRPVVPIAPSKPVLPIRPITPTIHTTPVIPRPVNPVTPQGPVGPVTPVVR